MALYEKVVDGATVARAFTVDGSDEDARMAALVIEGPGWRRIDDADGAEAPGPSRTRARRAASKE